MEKSYDLLIVGAGLSGVVIAEQASKRHNLKSLIIDKRDHVGGNCYDYIDGNGIRVGKYGLHIFHTSNEWVWRYVNQYSEWIPYEHRVKGLVEDQNGTKQFVPIPPNQETVNTLFGTDIRTVEGMKEWLAERTPHLNGREPRNGEEMSLQRVGADLYEKVFKHYTKKNETVFTCPVCRYY